MLRRIVLKLKKMKSTDANPEAEKSVSQRRFPRVHFRGDIGEAAKILGARLLWSNQEVSDVFDLSFKGFATARPGLVNLNIGSLHSVNVELGETPAFLVPVKVVWASEQQLGLELEDCPASVHLRLSEFLSDKLIGQNLRAVDKQFFSAAETFHHWFLGPNSTHLFVWTDEADSTRVVRVLLELDADVWEFENRRVTRGETLNARAIQILGQMIVTEFRLKDVIEKVAAQG
jgi:hypothetical protein